MCWAVPRVRAHCAVSTKKNTPGGFRGLYITSSFFSRRLLMLVVVFGAVDLAGLAILLAGDLGALLRRQLAAVGLTVRANLMIDSCLISFQMSGFSLSQLAAFDAIRDPIMLVFLALANGPV